jgi:metal-dependent amidase/aminoacylase/carboxypeptidase family protein
MNLIEPIVAQAEGITAVRRDIHAHPELCFEEVRTADVVAGKLTEWGIPVAPGTGHHGRGGHRARA